MEDCGEKQRILCYLPLSTAYILDINAWNITPCPRCCVLPETFVLRHDSGDSDDQFHGAEHLDLRHNSLRRVELKGYYALLANLAQGLHISAPSLTSLHIRIMVGEFTIHARMSDQDMLSWMQVAQLFRRFEGPQGVWLKLRRHFRRFVYNQIESREACV